MNEPIISPWIIYLIETSDALKIAFILVGVGALLFFIFNIVEMSDDDCVQGLDAFEAKKEKEDHRKWAEKAVICLFICLCGSILLPSKTTAYSMLAASIITPAAIESAQVNVIDFIEKVAAASREKKAENDN